MPLSLLSSAARSDRRTRSRGGVTWAPPVLRKPSNLSKPDGYGSQPRAHGFAESLRVSGFARRCPNSGRADDQLMRRSLREAAVRQYGPFSPANVVSLSTAVAERISKSKIFGSPNVGEFEWSLRRRQ